MPSRYVPNSDLEYFLIVFDEYGQERREPDGSLLSETILQRVKSLSPRITDVFFMSHGWKGDVPAAIEQYDAWVNVMGGIKHDLDEARKRRPGFAPLMVGLHWPSLPWGDETISVPSGALLSAGDGFQTSIEAQVEIYAARVANSPRARAAIRSILEAARDNPEATSLPPVVREEYETLFAESGLGTGDTSGCPGADQDGFDPEAIIADALNNREQEETSSKEPALLGVAESLRNAVLMPLRQLSFWKIKDRARRFGESGAHELIIGLQRATPTARFHLMGHSFGCIVVSAAAAGAPKGPPLPRPVDSLFLVQGAVSLWSYADDIPYAPGTAGYFNRILRDRMVRGPIVTTRSDHDTAVGRIYPIGAGLKKQLVLGGKYPAYGGIGAFGIQGLNEAAQDSLMLPTMITYQFRGGGVYNLEASDIIKKGGGISGAHSDIAHPEVAHAFWQAALTPLYRLPVSSEGGMLLGLGKDKSISQSSTPASELAMPIALRWINAELKNHAAHEPLVLGERYTLAFDVDVEKHVTAVGGVQIDVAQLFPKGTDEVELTVQVDSADFEVSDQMCKLRVPRTGRSYGEARFEISPKHDGPSTIKATIHKDGNFIQQMELTFHVGATSATTIQVTPRGRPVTAAGVLHPRDVGLSISPASGVVMTASCGAPCQHERGCLLNESIWRALLTQRVPTS
jgi:pimeloyl-ACP methyl ester carboxylesterase